MAISLLGNILSRFSKPLIGLGLAGVSTTLVACYGPDNYEYMNEAQHKEYCEAILIKACVDETVEIPEDCHLSNDEMNTFCEEHKDAQQNE